MRKMSALQIAGTCALLGLVAALVIHEAVEEAKLPPVPSDTVDMTGPDISSLYDGIYKMTFMDAAGRESGPCLFIKDTEMTYERGYAAQSCAEGVIDFAANATSYKMEKLEARVSLYNGFNRATFDLGEGDKAECFIMKDTEMTYERGYLSMDCKFNR